MILYLGAKILETSKKKVSGNFILIFLSLNTQSWHKHFQSSYQSYREFILYRMTMKANRFALYSLPLNTVVYPNLLISIQLQSTHGIALIRSVVNVSFLFLMLPFLLC